MTAFDFFLWVTGSVGVLAGAIASISGFGIGSLLTPLLGVRFDTKLAVAIVSVPHFAGTALRFVTMRTQVERRLLLGFGLTSAAGGLVGAVLHALAGSSALTIVFGFLLVFAGSMGVSGMADRMRFGGWMAWIAGAVSGLLGQRPGRQLRARDRQRSPRVGRPARRHSRRGGNGSEASPAGRWQAQPRRPPGLWIDPGARAGEASHHHTGRNGVHASEADRRRAGVGLASIRWAAGPQGSAARGGASPGMSISGRRVRLHSEPTSAASASGRIGLVVAKRT